MKKQEFQIFKKGTTTNGNVTVISNNGKDPMGKPFNREWKINKYLALGYKVFDMNGKQLKPAIERGDIVKIAKPNADEDPKQLYVVIQEEIEKFSDEEQIECQALETGQTFPPICRIEKKDLKIVHKCTLNKHKA